MKDLFERADFVKFAKYIATPEDNATVLPQAVRFVTATYQSQVEEEEIAGQAGNDGDSADRHARPDRASQERDEDYMPR